MAASLSGLVNGAPRLELFLCLIACGVNHRQPQVSLQQLLFSKVMHWHSLKLPGCPLSRMSTTSYLCCIKLCKSLYNTALLYYNRIPHSLYFISLFGSDSRTPHKRIYFNVNDFTASYNGIPPIELFRWITHISYRLSALGVPVRWPLRNSFESIKLFISFLHNT